MGPVSGGLGPVPSVRQGTDSVSQLRLRSVMTVTLTDRGQNIRYVTKRQFNETKFLDW